MAKKNQAAQAEKPAGDVGSSEGFDVSPPASAEANAAENSGAATADVVSPTPAAREGLTGPDAWAAQNYARVADDLKRQAAGNPPAAANASEAQAKDPIALALAALEEKLKECKNHIEVVAVERELESFKTATKLESRIKDVLLKRAGEYRHAMQQGNRPPNIGANEIAKHPSFQNAGIKAERMEYRARGDRDLASVLAENEALKQQLSEVNK